MSTLTELAQVGRGLRRAPLFTTVAVLILALGIGAASAVFTVVDAVLLAPLPYPRADELVGLHHSLSGIGIPRAGQSLGTYWQYQRSSRLLASVGAYSENSANLADPAGTTAAERVHGAEISASLLPTLGARPLVGRGFAAAEDVPKGPHVALIGEALWRRRFGADPAITSRSIQVNGTMYQIVGVMPERFRFPGRETQLWTPLALDPADVNAGPFRLGAVGRLRPGVSLDALHRELTGLLARLPEKFPNLFPGLPTAGVLKQSRAAVMVSALRDDVVGDFARVLWIVAATAALVLVVACANVANLLLVRAQGRGTDLAVRSALGASRLQLVRLFAAEGVILAAAASVVGILLALLGTRLLVRHGPPEIPRLAEVGVHGATLLFTALVALLVAAGCSAIPALRFGTTQLGAVLREGGRAGTAGRQRHRARNVLIAAQVALSLVLLAGSGLLARTVWHLHAVPLGFAPSPVLTLRVYLPPSQYQRRLQIAEFQDRLTTELQALPGTVDAGVVSKLPLDGGSPLAPVSVEGRLVPPGTLAPVYAFPTVSRGYFHTMGIPVLAGRTFGRSADVGTAQEMIVSRAFAERYWGAQGARTAVGKRIRLNDNAPWNTIVGVVESIRDTSLTADPLAEVYFPLFTARDLPDSLRPPLSPNTNIVIRASGDPVALAGAAQRTIHALDASLPVFDVRPMSAVVARAAARAWFVLVILGVASAITLVLGAVGLYGTIAYVVGLRTREIGVRMALGARPVTVSWLVVREGMLLAISGVVAGLVVFVGVGRFLRALLFDVSPTDPFTLVAVSSLLILVAVLASWLPARRAARVDPLEALRAEG